MELKPLIGFHGLALIALGIGFGIIRANSSETTLTVGILYLILGLIASIFTTHSIMNKLKTNERRYK